MPRPSRLRAALVGATSLVLLAAACGGDDTNSGTQATIASSSTGSAGSTDAATGTTTAAAAASSTASQGTFPVTVDHLWGSTTIEERPERIVTLGVTDADVVLALGTTPLALTGFKFFDTGLGPWATPLIEGDQPVLLKGEPNLEQIATFDPDLIVAVSAGFEETIYQQLIQIAPTVVRPEGTSAYQVSRDDATRLIAAALGQPEQGEELIDEADEAYAGAIAAHPEFAGKTSVVVLPYDGKYGAYTERDARGRVMAELGFELPPALAALDDGKTFFIEISPEQVALLDADVLVMLADAPDARAFVDGDAVLQAVPVVAGGRMVVPDTDTRGGMTYNTVLSTSYVIEHLVPMLAGALD